MNFVLSFIAEQLFGSATKTLARGMSFGLREWLLLVANGAIAASAGLLLTRVAHAPAEPGSAGSLLAGPNPAGGMIVAVGVVVVGLVFGRITSRTIGVEAAIFAACLGLWALAVRCGPVRPVLQYAGGRGVWLAMATEVLALGAALVGGWAVLERRAMADQARPGATPLLAVPNEVGDATVGQRGAATGVAVLVTAAVELLLVQTDAAAQCLGGVAIASFLGSFAGYSYLPLAAGVWYWVAPVLTAAVGYLAAFATGDGRNGDVHGYLAALARPTPLHAASLGVAAAVLGHWSCRRWAVDEEAPTPADADVPVA